MKYTKHLYAALSAAMLTGLAGCSVENDFDLKGEGTLRLRMVVNSEVTRAAMDQQTLADSCWVYLSDSKGLLYKYHGLGELPSSLPLRSGHYVAEAWTGDSVPASFDSKFYRGYQPFDITRDNVSSVIVNCRIANVVASVNPAENIKDKIKNYTVTIASTTGTLDFNADNIATAHGYYMMANDDNALTWNISGENADGKPFTKSGRIENVKKAHEYILNLKYNPNVSGDDSGGGFITVTVNEEALIIDDEITLIAAPTIKGEGFDVNSTYSAPRGSFSDLVFKLYAHESFSALQISTGAASALGLPASSFDLLNLTEDAATALRNAGLQWQFTRKDDLDQTNALVIFSAAMLNRLTDGEYTIDFRAVDHQGRTRTLSWKLNVSDAAVEALPANEAEIRSYSATLHGSLVKPEYTNPGIQYRRLGDTDWSITHASGNTRASQEFDITLTGLLPGTTYEYKAIADGYVNPKVYTFTTEAIFQIPNAGLEQWIENSKGAWIPGLNTTPDFWDTGNHGSITMGKNITSPATEIIHGGIRAARLESQFVGVGIIGKFAAGNIFVGSYDRTDGTDGVLTFGRAFNGTHPVKLRGWANYRPAAAGYAGGGLAKGDMDQGTVYVALTTKTYTIETKNTSDHPRVLFNPNDAGVLAYGEIVWTGNFAPDGQMAQFEIELTPRAGYFTSKPSHIILVASASRYGDYFAGGNSVLYIDDLELVYE